MGFEEFGGNKEFFEFEFGGKELGFAFGGKELGFEFGVSGIFSIDFLRVPFHSKVEIWDFTYHNHHTHAQAMHACCMSPT